jgi:Ran GTPase-activating protein (RanGAP) involved in mRNA processing and transport
MCGCGQCPIQQELSELCRSPHVAKLRELDVGRNRIDALHLRLLFHNTTLKQLRHLDLSQNPFGSQGIAALVDVPALATLESLDLAGVRITLPGFQKLAEARLPNLKRLSLRATGVGVQALRIIIKSPLFNQLRELDLTLNEINARGVVPLLREVCFESIETLDLRDNNISNTAALRVRFGKRVKV